MKKFQIRPLNERDRVWIASLLKEWWAGPIIVTRGKVHQADELPGFIAIEAGKSVGLVTYDINRTECEITSMNSLVEGKGIGSALIDTVKNMANKAGCKRIWLIITNDNTAALKFWQKKGFKLAAVYTNAIAKSRLLKPEIPLTGNDGIPIRDEIELEIVFK